MNETCYLCGIDVPEGEQQIVAGEVLCPDCYDSHRICYHCHNIISVDDSTYVESTDIEVCPSCLDSYTTCECCDSIILNGHTLTTYDDYILCEECYNAETYTCDDCGHTTYLNDSMYWNDNVSAWYCEDCCANNINGLIKDYHHHKHACEKVFFGNPDNNRYFGVELEIEVQGADREELEEIASALDQEELYFEEDGSLADGFEIISQPMSLEYHLNNFNWENLGDVLVEHCVNPSRNCGMHVHVSRTGIDINTINRIIVLVENNYYNLYEIIGRDYNRYSESFFKESKKYSLKDAEETSKGSRYNWLNNTNKATIEFRFFNSTTDGKLIKDRLVFLNDLIEFCLANEVTEDTVVSLSENNKMKEGL